ncbi:hypothetical protein JXA12_01720 [Candidatus Woesearchaeota archaeon]|nr:hypothetical protein [Candidatus Woesearchaeota archaeon]
MDHKYQAIIDKAISELKREPYVEAIILFGSLAERPGGDHNDVDLHVIINEPWRRRSSKVTDGVLVERFYNPADKLLEYAKKYKESTYTERLINGKVLYDRNGTMPKLKEQLKEQLRKTITYDEREDAGIKYACHDQEQDIEKERDREQRRYLLDRYLAYLLEQWYQTRSRVRPKPNHIVKQARKDYPELAKKISDFYGGTNEEKLTILQAIRHELIGEADPEWTSERQVLEE